MFSAAYVLAFHYFSFARPSSGRCKIFHYIYVKWRVIRYITKPMRIWRNFTTLCKGHFLNRHACGGLTVIECRLTLTYKRRKPSLCQFHSSSTMRFQSAIVMKVAIISYFLKMFKFKVFFVLFITGYHVGCSTDHRLCRVFFRGRFLREWPGYPCSHGIFTDSHITSIIVSR